MATVTMPPPTTAIQAARARFAQCFRRVVFARHTFEGRRLIKGVAATLNGVALDARRVKAPPVSLLPPAMEKEIDAALAGLDAALDYTKYCGVRGTRLVSTTACDAFVAAWNDARDAFNAVADSIAARHQEIVEFNRDYWLPLFGGDEALFADRVGSKIPGPAALRARFSVTVYLDDAAELTGEFASALAEAFFTEAAENRAALDAEVIKEAAATPSEHAAVLREFLDQLETGTKVSDKSLTKARVSGQRCLGMEAIIAPAVHASIATLDAALAAAQEEARAAIAAGGTATAYFKANAAALRAEIAATIALCEDDAAQQQMLSLFGVSGPRGLAFESDFDD